MLGVCEREINFCTILCGFYPILFSSLPFKLQFNFFSLTYQQWIDSLAWVVDILRHFASDFSPSLWRCFLSSLFPAHDVLYNAVVGVLVRLPCSHTPHISMWPKNYMNIIWSFLLRVSTWGLLTDFSGLDAILLLTFWCHDWSLIWHAETACVCSLFSMIWWGIIAVLCERCWDNCWLWLFFLMELCKAVEISLFWPLDECFHLQVTSSWTYGHW